MKKLIAILMIFVFALSFISCNMEGYNGVHILYSDGTVFCKKGISSYYDSYGSSITLTFSDGTTITTDTTVATIYTTEKCPICEGEK